MEEINDLKPPPLPTPLSARATSRRRHPSDSTLSATPKRQLHIRRQEWPPLHCTAAVMRGDGLAASVSRYYWSGDFRAILRFGEEGKKKTGENCIYWPIVPVKVHVAQHGLLLCMTRTPPPFSTPFTFSVSKGWSVKQVIYTYMPIYFFAFVSVSVQARFLSTLLYAHSPGYKELWKLSKFTRCQPQKHYSMI